MVKDDSHNEIKYDDCSSEAYSTDLSEKSYDELQKNKIEEKEARDIAFPASLRRDNPRPGAFAVDGPQDTVVVNQTVAVGDQTHPPHMIAARLVDDEESQTATNTLKPPIFKAEKLGWSPTRRQFTLVIGFLLVAVTAAFGLGLGLGLRSSSSAPPSATLPPSDSRTGGGDGGGGTSSPNSSNNGVFTAADTANPAETENTGGGSTTGGDDTGNGGGVGGGNDEGEPTRGGGGGGGGSRFPNDNRGTGGSKESPKPDEKPPRT